MALHLPVGMERGGVPRCHGNTMYRRQGQRRRCVCVDTLKVGRQMVKCMNRFVWWLNEHGIRRILNACETIIQTSSREYRETLGRNEQWTGALESGLRLLWKAQVSATPPQTLSPPTRINLQRTEEKWHISLYHPINSRPDSNTVCVRVGESKYKRVLTYFAYVCMDAQSNDWWWINDEVVTVLLLGRHSCAVFH